tara:strand:- start:1025 stop:1675 length:651 start_codon:yes stop_codon:yes gene_type:complete
MEFSDLGHAEKIIAGSDSSIILKDNTKEVDKRIVDRVNQLRDLIKITTKQADIDFTLSRIASLTGGIGVIYAGGNTDLEQKELFDRIDDAVCAVRSALEEGILPGGGIALYNEARKYDCSEKTAEKILAVALRAPLEQIFNNAGLDIDIDENKSYDYGYNIKTGEFGDMYKMGVIDPLKVTRSALENAVSVAATILSTNAIITMARSIEQATNYTS